MHPQTYPMQTHTMHPQTNKIQLQMHTMHPRTNKQYNIESFETITTTPPLTISQLTANVSAAKTNVDVISKEITSLKTKFNTATTKKATDLTNINKLLSQINNYQNNMDAAGSQIIQIPIALSSLQNITPVEQQAYIDAQAQLPIMQTNYDDTKTQLTTA
jgi:chromosome segregation ATPase